MRKLKIKLFLLAGFAVFSINDLLAVPAPAYLSNPFFSTCKALCPVIDHGTWQELNLDCIYPCIWFYEGKHALSADFDQAWTWVDTHI